MTRYYRSKFKPGIQATDRKPPKYYEEGYQIAVAHYLRVRYPNVMFTISPSLHIKSMFMARKVVAMGYRKGTPDLMIFKPVDGYHGLFIEMKTPPEAPCGRGTASADQKEFIDYLGRNGYRAVICYGSNEAIEEIDKYMERL